MRILASLCVAVLLLGLVSLRVDASELQAALEEEIDRHCAGEALHPSAVSEERRA